MSGLSSKALAFGTPENKLKYNGKEEQKAEFSDGSGLDWLDYGARMYDAQIGRWSVVDPFADKWNSYSTYIYALNQVTNVIDPDGNNAIYTYDEKTNTITVKAKIYYLSCDFANTSDEGKSKVIEWINNQIKSVFKDGQVKVGNNTYNIKFDIKAEIKDVDVQELGDDENIMLLEPNAIRDHVESKGKGYNNFGVLQEVGTIADIHEIGHMLGFKDRYSDYEDSKNPKEWRSFTHDGYEDDLMGSGEQRLNNSHYDAIVGYVLLKLIDQQKHLLPEKRTNSTKISNHIDDRQFSSVNPNDIPSGWVKRNKFY